MSHVDPNSYPVTPRSRVRRRPERASYDRAAVHAALDAALMCTVAYVIDGQPFATPTAFWREGDAIFWHGSAASRMIEAVDGAQVCVNVALMDGLVLARSARKHSVNYRSVTLFGRAEIVTDPTAKLASMDAFIERLYPGRSAEIRSPTENELKEIGMVRLPIAQASAKARAMGVKDDDADYARAVWAGLIPFLTIGQAPVPDERLLVPTMPGYAAAYAGAPLDVTFARHAAEYHAQEK